MKNPKNAVVKKECHSRGMLSGIFHIPGRCSNLIKPNALYYNNTKAGDPRQKPSGMTPYFITAQGFTLIELLVVVLIIGILAAVAVPQYQKAVDRARVTEVVQLLSSLQKATDVWILANPGVVGESRLLSENSTPQLDIDLPCQYDEDGYCWINKNQIFVEVDTTARIYALYYYTDDAHVTIGQIKNLNDGTVIRKCGYYDDRGKGICEGLQGYEAEESFDI